MTASDPPQPYSSDYYRAQRDGARRSARAIVPLVLELVEPRSVLDVGCGAGAWLSVFRDLGIADIFGVDGGEVDELLEIPPERFRAVDLRRPLQLDRRFDLAVSLEVAEHLPPEYADVLVDSLTALGDVVLFSAAIPGQGGTEHLNEQWPDHWAGLFGARGYLPVDCLRRKVWNDDEVEWWYAQNILLFAPGAQLERRPALRREYEFAGTRQLSIVHPHRYLEWIEWGTGQWQDG